MRKAYPLTSSSSTDRGSGPVDDRVLVGRVGRAHGLNGAVVVEPLTDAPDVRFAPGSTVVLDDGTPLTVTRLEATDRHPLVTFEGIDDRSRAEDIRGHRLYVTAADRRELDEGEYWPEELIGMRVLDRAGAELGRVSDVEIGVGQDRLIIDTDSGAFTLPFVADLVPAVDLESRVLVAELPPGIRD